MSEKYFVKFPLVAYNGTPVVNITERAAVRNNPLKNPYLFYPYELTNDQRPDQLADQYLNDEYMDWMIYLSNGIIDPYYDWYMRDDVFNDYIVKKYGSLSLTTAKVLYYRNNWYEDQTIISPIQYGSLPDIQKFDARGNLYLDTTKKYYEIILNGDYVVGYQRKRSDDTVQTNKIVRYALTGNSAFTNNEVVSVNFGYQGNTYVTTGKGQVLSSNSTYLTIQHTSGYVDTAPDGYNISFSNSYVYGTESSSNCLITAIRSMANNITSAEAIYWSPVTIYEQELENNLKNKTIRLIDSSVAQDVANYVANTLNNIL